MTDPVRRVDDLPDHPRSGEHGKVKVMFFPGCLVISIVLSVVGTILLNVLIRLFD